MDSSLHEVWQAASGRPFVPAIGKDNQFLFAFLLVVLGLGLSGAFALNRSLVNVPLLGVPASLALALGVVYMFYHVHHPPIFRAVASSTRPLYQLLKSIGFTNKVHVEITENGLRFAADHGRVMQGVAHWSKSLFTTYTANIPRSDDDDDDNEVLPSFQISLPALLETLQIFGATDAAARQAKADADPYRSNLRNYRPDAFSNQTLGMSGTCSLSYTQEGEPFSIVLEEAGVKTTCNLTTYMAEIPDDIPFDIEDISFKIITQARVLLDALGEIAPSQPDKLTLTASRREPFLRLSSAGALGSSSVDFARGKDLLETFTVRDTKWRQTFKFDIIKSASEAMRIASKVSLRGDRQGVLTGLSFLDFRFVPYAENDDEDDEDGDDGEGSEAL
ncbi:repair protein Rad1/Rec1/Rad17-domain-containing protein [Echria macrotheca]|uniref:Repair protein Rad1/Rec1/Rad17-domain-containing protein n=1 Tax=Echria macrotheca TaxID=438768 RepID=A0AAJ0B6N4_9PEZI|nr:repair protein Rad1/Rec1/Rad17-domain-containing protein [Echria macrotheca]